MIWRVLGLHGLVGLMGFGFVIWFGVGLRVCGFGFPGGLCILWVRWFGPSLFCVSVFAVRFSFVWGLV